MNHVNVVPVILVDSNGEKYSAKIEVYRVASTNQICASLIIADKKGNYGKKGHWVFDRDALKQFVTAIVQEM